MKLPGFNAEAALSEVSNLYRITISFIHNDSKIIPQQQTCKGCAKGPGCLSCCQDQCQDPGNCDDPGLTPAGRAACRRAAVACFMGCFRCCGPPPPPPPPPPFCESCQCTWSDGTTRPQRCQ
jgi:hypothetical protein